MRRKLAFTLALLLVLPAHAHIGSPDTFVQATAGPYKFLIAAHPPATYPGALELDLRFNPDDRIGTATAALDGSTPTPIQIFDAGTATTTLWLPTPAAHTIHIALNGNEQGSTYDLTLPSASQPVVAESSGISNNDLKGILAILSALLAIFIGLGLRERSHSRPLAWWHVMAIIASTVVLLVAAGKYFLVSNAPPAQTTITTILTPSGMLDLTLTNPAESFTHIVPDDGKLMHLFLIRQPNDDVFLHLHPAQLSSGHFSVPLPAMPPGTYQLFMDFYLSPTGNIKDARSETDTETLTLPAQFHPVPADPDNTIAVLPPAGSGVAHSSQPYAMSGDSTGTVTYTSTLRDNYSITLTTPATLRPLHANLFQVTLLDPAGHSPSDMATYLAMPAHAVVLRSDNSVFAHIHPGGTLPMLSTPDMAAMQMPMDLQMMPMPDTTARLSNTATIPYGFPSAGRYRVFVQMKHGSIVETAAFDLTVN